MKKREWRNVFQEGKCGTLSRKEIRTREEAHSGGMEAGPGADLSGGEGLCEVLCPVFTQVKGIVSFLRLLSSLCQALCTLIRQ